MYSLISIRVRAFSSLNKKSASVLANSVLPTPVGPIHKKLPKGRFMSERPALFLLIASETTLTASSCPTTRACKTFSSCKNFCISLASIFETGIPVHIETIRAISSSQTSSRKSCPCWPAFFSSSAVTAAIFFSSSGIFPYFSSAALFKFPSRLYLVSSIRSCSNSSLYLRDSLMRAFSFCHWACIAFRFEESSANSSSSFKSLSFEAVSFSFPIETFSIFN